MIANIRSVTLALGVRAVLLTLQTEYGGKEEAIVPLWHDRSHT